MKKKELLDKLIELKDDEEVDEVINNNFLTLDNFKMKIENDKDFKSFLDSEKDKHSSKAINTAIENFKNKDMKRLIDEEVAKRTGENESPEQKQLHELQKQIIEMKKEKEHAEMLSKYKDVLNEKKIPSNLADLLLTDNEESTNANIELFENSMKDFIDQKVNDRIKDTSYVPPKSNGKTGAITYEQVVENPQLYSQWKAQQNK